MLNCLATGASPANGNEHPAHRDPDPHTDATGAAGDGNHGRDDPGTDRSTTDRRSDTDACRLASADARAW